MQYYTNKNQICARTNSTYRLYHKSSRSHTHLSITIHHRKQAQSVDPTMMLFTVKRWGLEDPLLPYAENWICRAAVTQVAYDHGYTNPLSYTHIPAWNNTINKLIDGGSDGISCLLSSNHVGSIEYAQQIKTKFLEYLHMFYHQ